MVALTCADYCRSDFFMTREWCHYIGTFRDFFDVNRANKQSYLWLRAGGLLELSVDFYGATTRSQKSEHAVASGKKLAPPLRRHRRFRACLVLVTTQNRYPLIDFAMTRSYVATLINKHEADPAPGAHQTGVHRESYCPSKRITQPNPTRLMFIITRPTHSNRGR